MKRLAVAVAIALALALVGCAPSAMQDSAVEESAVAEASAELVDGSYVPTYFGWSGGSGRLQGITCEQVTIANGEATGRIVFQSPNYPQVKVGEDVYDNLTPGEDVSTFEIPMPIGENFTVSAQTTAMSQPHWVDYELHCELSPLATGDAPAVPGHDYERSMPLDYATGFSVHYYADGFKVISVNDDADYLVVPEGAEEPSGAAESFTVIHQPLSSVYLCATSAMALFDAIDGLSAVKLTGTDASGWSIQAPIDALESGDMKFAGKYNAPDYETIITSHCDLAVESTMILHNPEVAETLEQLGVPVFVDRSSYEPEPLGRVEWVKAYGALLNREDQAEEFFAGQAAIAEAAEAAEPTGKTVAFFAVAQDGTVTVRRPGDYIARSIQIAGGEYVFDYLDVPGSSVTVSLSMEEFYSQARDADYLVYNGAIEGELESIDALKQKSEVFASFKAVQEGNVFTCGSDLYQATDRVANMIEDFHLLVTGGDTDDMTFLKAVS